MSWKDMTDAELLARERERRDILAAIAAALDNHEEVHSILFEADDIDAARAALVARYGWREIDANAVMDMQQRRLPQQERDKIAAELRVCDARVAELAARVARQSD